VGLDVGAIGCISLVSLGLGGRNSFEHQNKFLIFGINNELRLPCGGFSTSPPIGNTCSLAAIIMLQNLLTLILDKNLFPDFESFEELATVYKIKKTCVL